MRMGRGLRGKCVCVCVLCVCVCVGVFHLVKALWLVLLLFMIEGGFVKQQVGYMCVCV